MGTQVEEVPRAPGFPGQASHRFGSHTSAYASACHSMAITSMVAAAVRSECPWQQDVKHTDAVRKLLPRVLDYNSEEHVWLVKSGFLDRINLKPRSVRTVDSNVVFSAMSAANAHLSTAIDREVDIKQFERVLMDSDCNIMINAPAGYGKTALLKQLVAPSVERRYKREIFGSVLLWASQQLLWARGPTPFIAWLA